MPLKRSKSKLVKGDASDAALAVNEFPDILNKPDKDDEKQQCLINQLTSNQTPNLNLIHEAIQIQKQSAEGLMSLLRTIGKAYSHLACYESRQAIDTIECLSVRHKRSAWAISLIAKAYFELADYKQAAKYE